MHEGGHCSRPTCRTQDACAFGLCVRLGCGCTATMAALPPRDGGADAATVGGVTIPNVALPEDPTLLSLALPNGVRCAAWLSCTR